MQEPSFDPGLTQRYTGNIKRAINPNGDFNIHRKGARWRDQHPYLFMVSISWTKFIAVVLGAFITVNFLFAWMYMVSGIQHLKGAEAPTEGLRFLNAFFFSTHTLTTVGYGSIYPQGVSANILAGIEALVGVMGFAVVTGLVFGRFSRPSARIGFSRNLLVAPYQDITALEFRIVNLRSNNIIDVNAQLLLMTVEACEGELRRNYVPLKLERDRVLFFPLPWTVVHPVTPDSPLYGRTKEDLARLQAEVMILIRGYDETFAQTVNARYSYVHDEFVWGARFAPAFVIDPNGDDLLLETDKISDYLPADLPVK